MTPKKPIYALPQPPHLAPLEPFVQLPDDPIFDSLRILTVLDWKKYGDKPWRFDTCKLEQCSLDSLIISKLRTWDSVFVRCDLSASRLFEASLLRSEFLGCRGTGVQLGESDIQDVRFLNCKLNMASFRSSKLERVVFENCILDDADFNGASLKNVFFIKCELTKTDFSGTKLQNVDLTKNDLRSLRGVMSLKNARITEEQLFELAPLFASEVGITF